jgi:hypothetical protein
MYSLVSSCGQIGENYCKLNIFNFYPQKEKRKKKKEKRKKKKEKRKKKKEKRIYI